MAWKADISVLIEQNRKQLETIDALQNILYLIGADAGRPESIRAYVEQAEYVITRFNGSVLIH